MTSPDIEDTFAALLRTRLKQMAMRPVDLLARLTEAGLGVSEATVRHWLSGERHPRAYRLEALLDVLEVRGGARDRAYRLHRQDDARRPTRVRNAPAAS